MKNPLASEHPGDGSAARLEKQLGQNPLLRIETTFTVTLQRYSTAKTRSTLIWVCPIPVADPGFPRGRHELDQSLCS